MQYVPYLIVCACACAQASLVFAESSCEAGVGQLWVELLRFYSLDFQLQDRVLSVRTSAPLWRDNKDWPRKRIAIEGQ